MADDKQLTVAELLARNAKEKAGSTESDQPRRRRRRSLEDGGVSVAELTGSLSKVKSTPPQAKHSNVDIDETAPVIPAPKRETQPAPKPADAEARKAEEIKKAQFARQAQEVADKSATKKEAAKKEAAKAAEAADKSATEKAAEKPAAEKPDTEAASPSSEDTTVIKRVADEPKAEAKTEPKAEVSETERTGEIERVEDDFDEEDAKLNPVAVVILALAGIMLGAVVFKGFEILWDSFSRTIVALLAIAVTAIMAGVVHALRTDRDKATMALAVVVGLILTFGPLLIV